MLTTLLDPATLFALFDAPGLAVQATIEQGGWSGMLWPGHPDRGETATLRPDDVRAGAQLLSLALHYFTSRHPDADALQTCTATQGLCRYTVTFLSGYPVEEEAIYAHADAWLLALAGGTPPAPGGCMALTPPYDEAGHPVLPGGDIAAFTRAMVPIMEALVFTSEEIAHHLAEAFLRQAGDAAVQRAADIFPQCVPGSVLDLNAPIACADCGAEGLERWYTGAMWGTTLGEACYQVRVAHG